MRTIEWHFANRLTKSDGHGNHVLAYGARVGYWPCLNAYFLQVTIGKHILEIWYGLASYKC